MQYYAIKQLYKKNRDLLIFLQNVKNQDTNHVLEQNSNFF